MYDGTSLNLSLVSNALKSLLLVMEVNTQLILRKMADNLRFSIASVNKNVNKGIKFSCFCFCAAKIYI